MSEKTVEDTRPEDPGRPLSEDEKSLLKRILAEPLEFPIEFRSWLKNFIETCGAILPRSSISGIGGTGVRFDDFPPGVIMAWAGSTIPSASLPCNGAAVSRDFYKDLFAAIGTTWGAGDGTTTFNVPDCRDRALYGAGSKVGLATNDGRAIGNRGGPWHHHYFTDSKGFSGSGSTDGAGSHAHTYRRHTEAGISIQQGTQGSFATVGGTGGFDASTTDNGNHGHNVSVSGSVTINADTTGGYDQDKPSYAGVQYVITTGRTA